MTVLGARWRADRLRAVSAGGLVALAAADAALATVAPVPAMAAAIGATLGVGAIASRRSAVTIFLGGLVLILAGYAFFDKGFAYVGAFPVYVGEGVLALGAIAFFGALRRARFGVLHALLLAYMAWGLSRTLPYLGVYGFVAFRDGVLWIYALFAIILSVVVEPRHFRVAIDLYRRLLPLFLLWVPVGALVIAPLQNALPKIPGTNVPIIVWKDGDVAVHLAGIAAFVLLGLYASSSLRRAASESVLWLAWIVDAGLAGSQNRGGLLAMSAVSAVLVFARSSARWMRAALVGALLVVLLLVANPSIQLGGAGTRTLSFEQVINNVSSIFNDTGSSSLQDTKAWRLAWWNKIISYTVNGPYFWQGKGFGINLANDDGFQVNADQSLRAPHNDHLNILARTGVPGLVLWVLVQGAFAASMLLGAYRAWTVGAKRWVALIGWLFVYWAASMVNMSFDVYLDGPQGGIWFWAIMGLGMAAVARAPRPGRVDPDVVAALDPVDSTEAAPVTTPAPRPLPRGAA